LVFLASFDYWSGISRAKRRFLCGNRGTGAETSGSVGACRVGVTGGAGKRRGEKVGKNVATAACVELLSATTDKHFIGKRASVKGRGAKEGGRRPEERGASGVEERTTATVVGAVSFGTRGKTTKFLEKNVLLGASQGVLTGFALFFWGKIGYDGDATACEKKSAGERSSNAFNVDRKGRRGVDNIY
jgi:hypothetical protein